MAIRKTRRNFIKRELEKEKKELIARGEAAEQEVSQIKALLGNPHDAVKAVQKLVDEKASLEIKFEKTEQRKR